MCKDGETQSQWTVLGPAPWGQSWGPGPDPDAPPGHSRSKHYDVTTMM